jgi:hypothetical protein
MIRALAFVQGLILCLVLAKNSILIKRKKNCCQRSVILFGNFESVAPALAFA